MYLSCRSVINLAMFIALALATSTSFAQPMILSQNSQIAAADAEHTRQLAAWWRVFESVPRLAK